MLTFVFLPILNIVKFSALSEYQH